MKRNRTNQYSKPTTLTALLLVLLLLISGCADPSAIAGENVTTSAEATTTAVTTARPDGLVKKICQATVEDDFSGDKILFGVFPEYNQYEYTVEDFLEIGCTDVTEISSYKEGKPTSRCLVITLDKNSKENVLAMIKILELREDIRYAHPNYYVYIES